jgi:serine/threonine-protein kinase
MMETVDPDKLPPGTMVDSFRVVRRLGGGAYGTVYLVEEGGVPYALKIARQRKHSGDKRHTHERALRELNCLLSLEHPYIARVWAYSRWPHREEGYLYIVMEYVEGGTLAKWREDNRATPHEVVVLFDKVLEAVGAMHAQGILHRDLKPENILVAAGGKRPVVVDYGVARLPAQPQLTDTVLPPGTPRYTSPEALRFEAQNRRNRQARYEYTVKDELYALGVTLFDLLTDPQPDSHPQPVDLGIGLIPTPLAHEVNERVPVPLSLFVAKLLAPNPAERPASTEAARRDLAELFQYHSEEWMKRPLHPPPQLPPVQPPAPPVPEKRMAAVTHRWWRPRVVAAGAVVLGALLAWGVYLGLRTGAPAQPPAVAEETPPPGPAPVVSAEPLPASPTPLPVAPPPPVQPPPAQPLPTPEKGTPVNIREVPEDALCSQKTPPPRGTSRWLKWCQCAGIVGTLVALQAGCTGAHVRQSPTEECRKEAVEAMQLLELPFDTQVLHVQMDLTIPRDPRGEGLCTPGPCLDGPGPVTSLVVTGSGKLVKGTLLRGRVFADAWKLDPGTTWVYRWTEATLPNGEKHPVCIETNFGKGTCPDGRKLRACAVHFGNVVRRWAIPIIP